MVNFPTTFVQDQVVRVAAHQGRPFGERRPCVAGLAVVAVGHHIGMGPHPPIGQGFEAQVGNQVAHKNPARLPAGDPGL